MTVDTREWKAAARQLFETSSRTCVDFTNGQALKVASEAIRLTEKADRHQIEHIMGILSKQEKLRRDPEARMKGWVRITKRKIKDDSFAARIVAKRFRETGSWFGLKGKTLAEKAISLVKAKVRSVAFIRSGWIQAVRDLSRVVYKRPRIVSRAETKQIGRAKGFAVPAKFSFRSEIQARIVNTALQTESRFSSWSGKKSDPMPVAVQGLQAAIDFSAKDMLAELARRLDPDFKKVSA